MEANIGVWGEKRLKFLKTHRNGIYMGMLLSDTLWEHLTDIDRQANEMMELLVRQMKEAEGVTENLKARDQMEWVGRMNSIHARAREIVLNELIYS